MVYMTLKEAAEKRGGLVGTVAGKNVLGVSGDHVLQKCAASSCSDKTARHRNPHVLSSRQIVRLPAPWKTMARSKPFYPRSLLTRELYFWIVCTQIYQIFFCQFAIFIHIFEHVIAKAQIVECTDGTGVFVLSTYFFSCFSVWILPQ